MRFAVLYQYFIKITKEVKDSSCPKLHFLSNYDHWLEKKLISNCHMPEFS